MQYEEDGSNDPQGQDYPPPRMDRAVLLMGTDEELDEVAEVELKGAHGLKLSKDLWPTDVLPCEFGVFGLWVLSAFGMLDLG
jgi:hypothetical protein